MTDKKADVGVVVARFQLAALHPMHLHLLATAMERHTKVVVCLGVSAAGVPTKEDPLPFIARMQMINELYPALAHPGLVISPLPDMEDDGAWSRNLDRMVESVYPNQSAIVYGGRDSFAKYYTGKMPITDITMGILSLDESSGSEARREISAQPPMSDENFRRGIIYTTQQQRPHAYGTVDIAALTKFEGKLNVLLVRKPDTSIFRFPGGFIDPADPSDETAAARELQEETGLVQAEKEFLYLGSHRQDDWRYRKSDRIMTRLFSTQIHSERATTVRAADDVEECRWFVLDEKVRDVIHPAHLRLLNEVLWVHKICFGPRPPRLWTPN